MRPPLRSLALLLVALAAGGATVSGCGETEEEKVRATLDSFERATAEKDVQKLCDQILAKAIVQRIASVGLPCEVALRTALGQLRQPTLTISTVKVDGDKADARVRTTAFGQKPSTDTIKLVRENGDWRIASLAGTTPPPSLSEQER